MSLRKAQRRHHCRLRPPRGLVASSRAHLLRLTTPALRRIPRKFSIGPPVPGAVGVERAARLDCDDAIHACPPAAAALASFTSGATGAPKLALRSHGFLLSQHQAIAAALAHKPGEVDLIALPIFVLANLASRVTSVLPDADLRRQRLRLRLGVLGTTVSVMLTIAAAYLIANNNSALLSLVSR